ncbi:hypothetical protein [Synechococcus sp. MU1655]|nr:hypothetical protein [Synechococcus sp. MU1655]
MESADFAHSIADCIVMVAITTAGPELRRLTRRVWMMTTMDEWFY